MKKKKRLMLGALALLLVLGVVAVSCCTGWMNGACSVEDDALRIELASRDNLVTPGGIYKLFVYGGYSNIHNLQFSVDSENSGVSNNFLEGDACADGSLYVGDWEQNETLTIRVADAETGAEAYLTLEVAVDAAASAIQS